ncbi:hypothetical protein Q4R01_17540 [Morganella morganii]|uniref:Uncharacterized protein n=1 Tax=Morganella morganii TaxID=582 RepID=A0A0A2RE08_MORMO|nr:MULTISPECIES: hypothetical protein [Morganella]ARM68119.1 hypothetical protein [Morganella morganii]AZP27300.1 hypothetical protein D8758_18295 [Morganella morganii]KGP45541.1 hypothetical protein LR61_05950 [Morganella morganii]MBA5857199.1 hypothetical protein [Morganella morganii]MBT0337720.1 hypothetical protein [Morganella morganii subsp. morganii]
MKILWGVVVICAVIGLLDGLLPAITMANSAPQQAAGAAIGIAWAVIPYCLVKAISMMKPRVVIVESADGGRK